MLTKRTYLREFHITFADGKPNPEAHAEYVTEIAEGETIHARSKNRRVVKVDEAAVEALSDLLAGLDVPLEE